MTVDSSARIRRRRQAGLFTLIALTLLCQAPQAAAQTATRPTAATPWDVAVVTGGMTNHPETPMTQGYVDDWIGTGLIGVGVGRHFTPHLKAELDVSFTNEGEQYVERRIAIPSVPYPVSFAVERQHRVRELSASLIWQFLENQWVHPFLQIGVAADSDRVRERTWRQTYYIGGAPRPDNQVVLSEDRTTDPVTTTEARLLMGGGAKLYVSPRFFFRTDVRTALDRKGGNVAFRGGFGIDF
jgi:hypothetical protein